MSIPEKDRTISDKLERGEELTKSEICYFMDVMGKFVSEETGKRHRWTEEVHTVTRLNGKLYAVDWERGLTENNDDEYLNQPYEVHESDIPKPALSLYLLTQRGIISDDTYDSCLVCAESEDAAKRIHPDTDYIWRDGEGWIWKDRGYKHDGAEWPNRLENIRCKLIGTAQEGIEKGVVIASYNVG